MSSVPGIAAAAAVGARSQLQSALAAKMVKMNAENQQSLVALLQAATENLEQITKSSPPPGQGQAVDISV